MAGNRKTLDTDLIYLREVYARTNFNQTIPVNQVLIANGDDSTRWDYLRVSTFNTVIGNDRVPLYANTGLSTLNISTSGPPGLLNSYIDVSAKAIILRSAPPVIAVSQRPVPSPSQLAAASAPDVVSISNYSTITLLGVRDVLFSTVTGLANAPPAIFMSISSFTSAGYSSISGEAYAWRPYVYDVLRRAQSLPTLTSSIQTTWATGLQNLSTSEAYPNYSTGDVYFSTVSINMSNYIGYIQSGVSQVVLEVEPTYLLPRFLLGNEEYPNLFKNLSSYIQYTNLTSTIILAGSHTSDLIVSQQSNAYTSNYYNKPMKLPIDSRTIASNWAMDGAVGYYTLYHRIPGGMAQLVPGDACGYYIGNRGGMSNDVPTYINATPLENAVFMSIYNKMPFPLTPEELAQQIATSPAPGGFLVLVTTDNEITFSWQGAVGAIGYLFIVNGVTIIPGESQTPFSMFSAFSTPPITAIVTGKSARLTGLLPGTQYAIVVVAIAPGGGRTQSDTVYLVTSPGSPENLSVSGVNNLGFTVSWLNAVGATSYSFTLNGLPATPLSQVGQSASFTNLSPNTTYLFGITAINSGGETTSTEGLSIKTAPAAPTIISSTIGVNRIIIRWQGGDGATSYSFLVNGEPTPPQSETTLSATFFGLLANTQYNFVVIANGSGGATESAPYSVSTGGAPTDLSANSITSTGFRITWDGSFDDAVYSYRLNGNDPSYYDITVITEGKEAIFTSADPNTVYSVVVVATRDGVASSSAAYSLTTLPNPPTALVVSPQSITASGFTLSWIGAVGATSYTYSFNGSLATPNSTGVNSATFTGLSNSTLYSNIRITARNRGGFVTSEPIFVTTLTPPPTKPILAAGLRTATSLRVVWQSGTNATSFSYSLDGQGVTPLVFTPTSVTFEGLQENRSYTIRVTGINITDSITSDPLILSTLRLPPTAPQITSSAITSSGFTVSWLEDLNVTSYTYRLNGNTATPSSSTTTSAIFGGLSADTQYSIIVTANNNNPVSAASNAISLRTLLPPPAAPVPTSSLITDTSFTISWPVVLNATGYNYSVNGAASIDAPSRTVNLTGLTPNTPYEIVVRATNNNPIVSSATLSVTTLLPRPGAPSLSLTTRTNTGFTVSWPAIPSATSFTYKLNGGTEVNTTTSTSTTLTGLTADTQYSIIVIAKNNNANVESDPLAVRTLLPPPAAPLITLTTRTDTGFTVSWSALQNVTSYTYTLGGSPATPASSTSTSATFGGLLSDTSYDVVVTANNNNPISGSSNTLAVRTLLPRPGVPSLSLTTRTDTGFTVSWPAIPSATSFTYRLNGATEVNTTTSTSTTLTGLSADTSYNIIVIAKNNNADVSSDPLAVRTLPPAPGVPVPTSSLITETSFTVSWPVVPNATSYTYKLNGGSPINAPSRTVTLTGLNPNNSYNIEVTATNNNTSRSATLSITTLRTAPATFTITSPSRSSTGFRIEWPEDSNVTSYTYTLNGSAATPASSNSTSATFEGLASDTLYNVIVTARNNNPVSRASNTLQVTTLLPAPGAPVPQATVITDTGFTVAWPAVPNATSYSYRIGNGSEITTSNTTFTLTGLNSNSDYSVVVTAKNNNGDIPSNTLNIKTLRPPPGTAAPRLVSRTTDRFVLTWDPVPNATSFILSISGRSPINIGDSRDQTVEGLTPNTNYTVIVTAINNNPVSSPSTPLEVTTLRTQPAEFTVQSSNITPTGFTVSWTLDTNVISYTYRLNGTLTTPSSSTTTSATFTNLTTNSAYDVIVIASNNNPSSRESSIQLRTIIAPPTNLSTSSLTYNSFILNWTGSPGANNYKFLIGGNAVTPTYTPGATTASFTNMADTTLFNVQVIATDGTRDSLPSTVLPVTTPAPPPPIVFSSSSTNLPNSYTIPEGYTNMYIEVLAGSGGGAGCGPSSNPSAGGGGGAYVYGTTVVSPGTQVNISDHNILGGIGGLASPDGIRTNPPQIGGDGESVVITIGSRNIRVGGGYGGQVGGGFAGVDWQPLPNSDEIRGDRGSVSVSPGDPNVLPQGLIARLGENSTVSTFNGVGPNAISGRNGYTGGYAGMGNAPAGDFRGNGQSGSNGYYLIRFTIGTTRPIITAASISTNSFILSWPLNSGATYTFTRNGGSIIPFTPTIPSVYAEFLNLSPNTEHTLIMTEIKNSISTPSNTLIFRTFLDSPTGVTPSNIRDNEFTLDWNTSSGATNYTFLLNGTPATPIYTAGTTTARFTGLAVTTLYNVHVLATDGTYSSPSSVASIQVRTRIASPTNLSASFISPTAFTLNWTASSGSNNYRFLLNGNDFTPTYTTGATTARFTGRTQSTTYNIQVVGTDGILLSAPSAVLPVTTIAPPPPIEFSSSGTNLPNSYTIPEGYTNIYVEVLAGSGGGGGSGHQCNASTGGGGAAYIYGTTAVNPGTQVAISDHIISGGIGGLATPDGVETNPPQLGGMGEPVTFTLGGTSIIVGGGNGGLVGGRYGGNNWHPIPQFPVGVDPSIAGNTTPLTVPSWLTKSLGDRGPSSNTDGQGSRARSGKDGYSGGAGGMQNSPPGDIRGNGTAGSDGYYLIRITSV